MLNLKCTFCDFPLIKKEDIYQCLHCTTAGAGCSIKKDFSFYESIVLVDNLLYKVISYKESNDTHLLLYNNIYKDKLDTSSLFDRKKIFRADIFIPLNMDNDFKSEIINLVNKLKRLVVFQ